MTNSTVSRIWKGSKMDRSDFNAHTHNTIGQEPNIIFLCCPLIQCKENQASYLRHNPLRHRIAKIKIDGGLIPEEETKKCDWLLVNWDEGVAFFIELKGSNRKSKLACEQLINTFDLLWPDLQQLGITVPHARIAMGKGKRVPATINSGAFLELKELFEAHNGTVDKKGSPWEESPNPFDDLFAFHDF